MTVDIFNTENRYDLILPTHRGSKARAAKSPFARILPVARSIIRYAHLKKSKNTCTIDKYLFEAQEIAERLGYKLHARLIWNKVTGIPAAFTVRYGHEYLLYMYKGKLRPVALEERGRIHTVFTERVQRHSQKPEISFDIIERLYPTEKKIELYARRTRPGWDCWGNEV